MKLLTPLIVCVCVAFALTGCGSSSNEGILGDRGAHAGTDAGTDDGAGPRRKRRVRRPR